MEGKRFHVKRKQDIKNCNSNVPGGLNVNKNQKIIGYMNEKKLEDVKLHPIYRIPLKDYRMLKNKKSQLLALIY